MYFEARTAWIPKDLEVPADYEDAFAVAPERVHHQFVIGLAVLDDQHA